MQHCRESIKLGPPLIINKSMIIKASKIIHDSIEEIYKKILIKK